MKEIFQAYRRAGSFPIGRALTNEEGSANADCLLGIWKNNEEYEEAFSVIETILSERDITLIKSFDHFDKVQGRLLANAIVHLMDYTIIEKQARMKAMMEALMEARANGMKK